MIVLERTRLLFRDFMLANQVEFDISDSLLSYTNTSMLRWFAPGPNQVRPTRRLSQLFLSETKNCSRLKRPYLYEFDGGKLFSLTGLWESWKDSAETLETFTLITADANELAAKIHDRMPVIAHPDDRQAWLAGEEIPLVSFPTNGMTASISKSVRTVSLDALLERLQIRQEVDQLARTKSFVQTFGHE